MRYDGAISMISALADESASGGAGGEAESEATTYTVYIDFTPDANTRYGMSAVISTLDGEAAGEEAEDEAVEENEEEPRDAEARAERREGMPEGFPEELPEDFPMTAPEGAQPREAGENE